VAVPAGDLDTLISELQRLRAEHGNIPTAVYTGLATYVRPLVVVEQIASGPVKPLMRPVRFRGQPIVLITTA
jgi:hypothetical protein